MRFRKLIQESRHSALYRSVLPLPRHARQHRKISTTGTLSGGTALVAAQLDFPVHCLVVSIQYQWLCLAQQRPFIKGAQRNVLPFDQSLLLSLQ